MDESCEDGKVLAVPGKDVDFCSTSTCLGGEPLGDPYLSLRIPFAVFLRPLGLAIAAARIDREDVMTDVDGNDVAGLPGEWGCPHGRGISV